MIGFVFSNEIEAKAFWKKVISKKDSKTCAWNVIDLCDSLFIISQPSPKQRRRRRRKYPYPRVVKLTSQ